MQLLCVNAVRESHSAQFGLKVIDKHAKVFFDLLIDLFGLSVCLRVIGSRGIALDLEEIVEVLHKFGHEYCSPI